MSTVQPNATLYVRTIQAVWDQSWRLLLAVPLVLGTSGALIGYFLPVYEANLYLKFLNLTSEVYKHRAFNFINGGAFLKYSVSAKVYEKAAEQIRIDGSLNSLLERSIRIVHPPEPKSGRPPELGSQVGLSLTQRSRDPDLAMNRVKVLAEYVGDQILYLDIIEEAQQAKVHWSREREDLESASMLYGRQLVLLERNIAELKELAAIHPKEPGIEFRVVTGPIDKLKPEREVLYFPPSVQLSGAESEVVGIHLKLSEAKQQAERLKAAERYAIDFLKLANERYSGADLVRGATDLLARIFTPERLQDQNWALAAKDVQILQSRSLFRTLHYQSVPTVEVIFGPVLVGGLFSGLGFVISSLIVSGMVLRRLSKGRD